MRRRTSSDGEQREARPYRLLVVCDATGCHRTAVFAGPTLKAARKLAVVAGWKSNDEPDELDRLWLCPACVAQDVERKRIQCRTSEDAI